LAPGPCYHGQLSVAIAVTSYIDGVGGSYNDGVTWLRSDSGHPVLTTMDRLFRVDISDNRVV